MYKVYLKHKCVGVLCLYDNVPLTVPNIHTLPKEFSLSLPMVKGKRGISGILKFGGALWGLYITYHFSFKWIMPTI